MFNLLVSAHQETWERPDFVLDTGRFLEYTDDTLRVQFESLDADAIRSLLELPTLFAYETQVGKPARVGLLNTVQKRLREVRVTFQFDPATAPIAPERLLALEWELDIRRFEMNRTHWAVKAPDLMDILDTAGLIPGAVIPKGTRKLKGTTGGSRKLTAQRASAIAPAKRSATSTPRAKVFLVHGRDDGAKHEVARFLEHLQLEPVILHERPNGGRTLITKFTEESAEVAFAAVLMTADDVGGLSGEPLSKRARQNVVFELAYLLGKLGHERVCALIAPGVERPSDFEGIAYVMYGPGNNWQNELARELKNAGIAFDLAGML